MISKRNNELKIKKFIVGALDTNCYLVYQESTLKGLLIDPGAYDPLIVEYIKDKGIEVEATINTHGHADHIAGDAAFGFPVMISEADESCICNPIRNLSLFAGGKVEPIQVQRLLKDGDMIKLGSIEFEVIHTPGHTPGGISIKYDDILFTGDTLFHEGIGRTDLSGGNYAILVKSIKEKLLVLPDFVKIFPGHGLSTTIGHEKKNNPFIS